MAYFEDIYKKEWLTYEEVDQLKSIKIHGIALLEEHEYNEMMSYFAEFCFYENLRPVLLTAGNGYWCVYMDGPLQGMVCYLSHDELSIEPRFKTLRSLLLFLQKQSNEKREIEYSDWESGQFDFPKSPADANIALILQSLYQQYNILLNEVLSEEIESAMQQVAFSIMALTPYAELEQIYTFLDSSNMYIQERAIQVLGFHRYKPAKIHLSRMLEQAMPNGKSAAISALKLM